MFFSEESEVVVPSVRLKESLRNSKEDSAVIQKEEQDEDVIQQEKEDEDVILQEKDTEAEQPSKTKVDSEEIPGETSKDSDNINPLDEDALDDEMNPMEDGSPKEH